MAHGGDSSVIDGSNQTLKANGVTFDKNDVVEVVGGTGVTVDGNAASKKIIINADAISIVSKDAPGLAPALPATNSDASFLNGEGEWKHISFGADCAHLDERIENPYLRLSVGSAYTVFQTQLIGAEGIKIEADDLGDVYFSGVIASKDSAGLMPALTNNANEFLCGNGTWKTIATVIDTDTTYTFESGDNGQIKITPKDSAEQSVTVYTHPTGSGNNHIPTGGSSGQYLGWNSDGAAKWINLPTALKNPNAITIQAEGTTLENGVYDGSAAKIINITKESLGLDKVENKSSAAILEGLTADNVASALNFVPAKENHTHSNYLENGEDVSFGNLSVSGDFIVQDGVNVEFGNSVAFTLGGVNVGNNLVNKINTIHLNEGDFTNTSADSGISWKQSFGLYDENNSCLKTGIVEQIIPIKAGNNITFVKDEQSNIITINATSSSSPDFPIDSLPIASGEVLGCVMIGDNITCNNGTISLTKENVANAIGVDVNALLNQITIEVDEENGIIEISTTKNSSNNG